MKKGLIKEVENIRKRHEARMDAEPKGWITIGHAHIPLNASGEPYGKGFNQIKESMAESGNKGSESTNGTNGVPKGSVIVSGKNGNMFAKSDAAKKIDTSDALKEVQNGAQNSLKAYMDKDGNLTPERQALHEKIVKDMFKDKVPYDGQATMTMSGGGPASGKSFVAKKAEDSFGVDTTVKIDPDEFKAKLPGYKEMARDEDGAAGYYHEESSAVAKMAYQYAVDNNINVVYDGTGDGSLNSVKSKIAVARDGGYKVEAEYVTVNTDEAIKRNLGRYKHGIEMYEQGKSETPPRLVGEEIVRQTHQKVTDISIQAAGEFDTFTLYDNNGKVGSKPVKIATCNKGGKLKVVKGQEKKAKDYLNKGASVYTIKTNGEIVQK